MNKNIIAEGTTMGATTHSHKEHAIAIAPFHSSFFESLHKEQWQEVRLGEMIKTNCKSIDKNYPYNMVQYLDTGSITDNKIESLQKFDLADLPSRAKRLVQDNDIIYSLVRPIQRHFGFIKNPRKNLVVSTGFCTITTYQNILDSKFLYYFLTFDETIEFLDLIAEASTSAYPAIKPSDIENLIIPLPPLNVQQQIAEILSSFDDKIDLLHRQNKTLESLALTLFRHTFIDNPNRNEWEEKPLSEIAEIKIGRTPPRKEKQWFSTNPKNTKWISIKDMDGNIFIFNTAECLTDEAIEKFNIPIIPKGVVILSFKMTVGRVSITSEDMLSNEAIAHFKLHDKYRHFTEYLYLFLKSFEYETLGSTSSIVTAINTELIKNIRIINPDKTTMKNFQIQAKGFFDKIYNNAKQIQNLQLMRDMLLAKILNEKMEV